ncbi:hypothetical protein DOTSEDRAFT_152278 [Dothistroma septosporum NZE10]|uniref:Uncharacterized protein n=1 Tax=Dothistroma septosporum (strain NZE10 / CBS 128990) TaxID=675120 RepID=N1PNC6_DOTSN|nr:hypothetical protein DOTSEDRAFT_152278 [Dothistroma septosporum NZE10]
MPSLLSTSPYLLNTAGALGLFPLSVGILGLANPASGWSIFSFPKPATTEAQQVGNTFFLFWASRDLFMGIITGLVWYRGDREVLGDTLLAASMVAGVDGVISKKQKGSGEWTHWAFVPVLVGVGGGLKGWFDG